MNLNKFTERSKEILNSAQVLAMMQNHQLLQPVHLLSAIIEDDDTASSLFAPAGLDLKGTKLAIEKELKKNTLSYWKLRRNKCIKRICCYP